MIPSIIFLLLRRFRRTHPQRFTTVMARLALAGKLLLMLVVAFCLVIVARAQEKTLSYVIKRNGNAVGNITVNENRAGNKLVYRMQSEVKTRFVFSFTAKALEEAVYENGILVYSSIYRKMNGNEKANKKTRASGKTYVINNKGSEETFREFPIRYNMLSIYMQEPSNQQLVFSDNFEQFLTIKKTDAHQYKIKFPDGS